MFATPAISDPWRLSVPAHRPAIEGPWVTRDDVVLLGLAALLLLTLAAPAIAITLVVVTVVGAVLWSGLKAVGPLTKPLVDGDPFAMHLSSGATGFAR
jgi:hypothetical protein